MKQNLRRILLCAALAGLPFMQFVEAHDWVPVGDGTTTVGTGDFADVWATTGAVYVSGDYISADAPNTAYNHPFIASGSDSTLNVYGTLYSNNPANGGTQVLSGGVVQPVPLKINGDVILDASKTSMTVNIKEAVSIEPYFEPPAGGSAVADCSQIYFNTGTASTSQTITVNVNADLEFRGKTTATDFRDLLVTFAGRGTVIFNMADGTSVFFNGQNDTAGARTIDPNTGLFTLPCQTGQAQFSANAGGCKVFVLMDQTQTDVTQQRNKVVFQRQSVSSANNNQRVLIGVGPNSVITYLSTNPTGLADPVAFPKGDGYGTVGFDPSNNGTGRMVLFIQGAYKRDLNQFLPATGEERTPNPDFNKIVELYPFNDGAVVVAGHFVPAFDPKSISGCLLPGEGETTSPGYDFSKPAGINAVMRVIDNQHFAADATSVLNPASPAAEAANRRGLLVISDTQNHSRFATDTYWDLYNSAAAGFLGVDWAYSNPANQHINVRKGYVVGVNGQLQLFHNTFLDHAAGSLNSCDPLAQCDFVDGSVIKPRNPAAFKTDGLDVALFISGNPFILDPISGQPTLSEFVAANPYSQFPPVQAQVLCYGNGTLYLKECASTKWGYLYNFWTSGPDPLHDATIDWTAILALGSSTYDGVRMDPTGNADLRQSGEGEHVLDVEGAVQVSSSANNTIINTSSGVARPYTTAVSNSGAVEMASTVIDYTGAGLAPRPLLADGTLYERYNSGTLFFNDFASFFNSILRHTDASKVVDGVPSGSEPAITGGERFWFAMSANIGDTDANRKADPNRFRWPEIQFFNSDMQLQESCCASGVRFVVKDIPETFDQANTNRGVAGSNASTITFFDHGDPLDTSLTGYGRIFLCGSTLNLMCDGSSNSVAESCYWNVFKHNFPAGTPGPTGTSLATSATVELTLQNGNQFHPAVQTVINAQAAGFPTDLFISKQRAHHLWLFSQPDITDAACNLRVGWPKNVVDPVLGFPAGDAGAFPGNFPFPTREPLIANDGVFFTSNPFSLTAVTVEPTISPVPQAKLNIAASVMCFGSFDSNGNSIKVPVATQNDSGVVFIDHGGEITITRPPANPSTDPIPGLGETESIPFQSIFATTLAKRLWNDYNFDGDIRVLELSGKVDLPHDQVIFEKNCDVQVYNITQEMFAARRGVVSANDPGTSGYVRMSFENAERTTRFDRSGGEEVTIGWFNRDTADLSVTPATVLGTAGDIPPKMLRRSPAYVPNASLVDAFMQTRAMESVALPIARPTDLLFVGPGDDITQMHVSGATESDPFVLDVSGDGVRPLIARVREITTLKSTRNQLTDRFIGEGAHAALFAEFMGRIGLGSREWNEHSLDAWNLLGKDYVTIYPLGSCVIDVNDNLMVTDKQALVATNIFGTTHYGDGTNGTLNDVKVPDRITFIATQPREIRIPAGGELDLSSFGQGTKLQQIAFGGNVKLIFEEGATLRLPNNPTPAGGVVLYFNDQSELIFEGQTDPSVFLPFTDSVNNSQNFTPNTNTSPSSNSRIRILGKGQIWVNKNAHVRVNGTVYVGVETDALTPNTDLTISIQRQGRMDIGDENLPGGTFQIGNQVAQAGSTINFALILNGPQATFHMDREGFFGIGAGILNKNGNPNGNATVSGTFPNPLLDANGNAQISGGFPIFNPDTQAVDGEWQIQALNNVNNVTVQLTNGIFEHKNIFDGSSNQASLMAIGSIGGAIDWIQNGSANINIRGGGNLALIPATATAAAPIFANIWDYAGPLPTGEQYSILGSGLPLGDMINSATPSSNAGTLVTFASSALWFEFLAFPSLSVQTTKRVDVGRTQFITVGGFTNPSAKYGNAGAPAGALQIYRQLNPPLSGTGTMDQALALGTLNATTSLATGLPIGFSVPQ